MKKIILIALLCAGTGVTAFAQKAATQLPQAGPQAASATLQAAPQRTFDPALFKEKSFAMETALKANDFAEAMKLFPFVQRMVMERGDDYKVAAKGTEARQLYALGNELKMLSQDLKANKDKALKIITQMQASYTN